MRRAPKPQNLCAFTNRSEIPTPCTQDTQRLLADTLALGRHAGVLGLVHLDRVPEQLQDALELGVGSAGRIWQAAVLGELLLELLALVDQQSGIAAVVHQLVAAISSRHGHHLLRAPPVLGQRLALPREDRGSACLGNSSCCVVLRAEDVARAPTHLGTQGSQRLDQNAGLDGHVQGAVDVHALERLRRPELLACRHQARHLMLCQSELLTAELGNVLAVDSSCRLRDPLSGRTPAMAPKAKGQHTAAQNWQNPPLSSGTCPA